MLIYWYILSHLENRSRGKHLTIGEEEVVEVRAEEEVLYNKPKSQNGNPQKAHLHCSDSIAPLADHACFVVTEATYG